MKTIELWCKAIETLNFLKQDHKGPINWYTGYDDAIKFLESLIEKLESELSNEK